MTIHLETFTKLPFGGVDRRVLLQQLASEGPSTAAADLAAARAKLTPQGLSLPEGTVVLMLGGSGGILRALAIQLLFGERAPIYAVHYDSEKLQIGVHHARAMMSAASEQGVDCKFLNADATRPETIAQVVDELRAKYKRVHLINGIAAGATKRFAEHGTDQVRDLDMAFDPVRQIADFSHWDSLRRIGLVNVEIATEAEIERTYKFMGRSTTPWAQALADAGLLVRGESLVAFTDYEYEPDDPVYALGPLSQAKNIQREAMAAIAQEHGVRTVRLCYPAMNTTALGAIPGGALMFAGTAQILLEQGRYKNIPELARETIPIFCDDYTEHDLRVDLPFQSVLSEFHRRKVLMCNENLRDNFSKVFCNPDL